MSTTATNGKPRRKQLADQLDRLDSVIDTLADGLHQAVADACKEGARAAVREVLMELISNPDLMAAVRPPAVSTSAEPPPRRDEAPPPAPPLPSTSRSFWDRVKDGARGVGRTVGGAAHTAVQTISGAVKPVADALRLNGTTRTVLGVALGVGLIAGATSLLCPVWMSAALATVGGIAAVGAAYLGASMNRLFAAFRVT